MMSRRFWIPILFSLPVTLVTVGAAFFVVWLDPGAIPNEGNRWGFAILFPYTLLIQFLGHFEAGNTEFSFITPVLLQFPIYGLALALANVKGKFRPTMTALLVLHLLALTITLVAAFWWRKTHPPEANFTRSATQQSLAADGAIACFSSSLKPFSLNVDRAPQLKASVGLLMSVLTDYEKTVVRSLVTGVLSQQQVEAVIREGELMDYDYTGCGYFLTIKHPLLPTARVVCDTPKLSGSADGIVSGFVIFIQNSELTIECHSWGDIDVPEWFRSRNVQIAAI